MKLIFQTIVCEEITEKMKNLLHDNDALTASNNTIFSNINAQLKPVMAKNRKLAADIARCQTQGRHLNHSCPIYMMPK